MHACTLQGVRYPSHSADFLSKLPGHCSAEAEAAERRVLVIIDCEHCSALLQYYTLTDNNYG